MEYDIAIAGGGIVGLATALALTRAAPDARLVLLEKEIRVASHQSGHNSGVVHSGIYYMPGSLKARLCVQGARRMLAFCDEHGIPCERVGKLVVAASVDELPRLKTLYDRALANLVPGVRKLGRGEWRELEPHAAGLAALYSPNTAIVDYSAVAETLRRLIAQRGVTVLTACRVDAIRETGGQLRLETSCGSIAARRLFNCAGLYSDQIARRMGLEPGIRIVPFRGEYYLLKPERRDLVRGLVYPVPDPAFPFLGVHFTRRINGQVEAGPNAVLAFAREGYTFARIRPVELAGTLLFPGFWRMAGRYWRTGLYEFYRSFSQRAFVRALQRLVPELQDGDVVRAGAGVRAQALSRAGDLVDDFRLMETGSSLHVLNAPSPAATASLAIGDYLAERALALFGLPIKKQFALTGERA